MGADVFLDSNVLLYSLKRGDPKAEHAADPLSAEVQISVQVLNEFTAVCRRKLKLTWKEIEERLDIIRAFCPKPLPITLQLHEHALLIAKRYQFRFYDCLIVASALDAGCKILYSEDMQHNQLVFNLRIVNPFL